MNSKSAGVWDPNNHACSRSLTCYSFP
ncbi:MAG: hypothetical protein HY661_16250 [Betaproteobacteria bacterium]|nr:hypothetical protein [Betaproteobacteria bacterium]